MSRRLLTGSLLALWVATTLGCGNRGGSGSANSPSAPGSRNPSGAVEFPTKACVREAFKFDYPASWAIDEADKDYDPDHRFSIDASAGAFLRFVIYDPGIDPSRALAIMAAVHEKNMPGATKTEFKQWGKYTGAGMILHGKVRSVFKATIRLFTFREDGKTFAITEYLSDDEREQVAPGFRVIEQSFQVIQGRQAPNPSTERTSAVYHGDIRRWESRLDRVGGPGKLATGLEGPGQGVRGQVGPLGPLTRCAGGRGSNTGTSDDTLRPSHMANVAT